MNVCDTGCVYMCMENSAARKADSKEIKISQLASKLLEITN